MSMKSYDVIIMGGGINGCAIAREMAVRGFKVALIEKNDLASGTSSASSKLAHGGLRYLEQGNLKLVFEACHERERLLKNAPHLVQPLPFLIPIYKGGKYAKWKLKIGLWLYDALSSFQSTKHHRFLSKEEALKLEPNLNPEGLTSAALYYDAQMDDARICIECAKEAHDLGADIFTYTEIEKIQTRRKKIHEIQITDKITHKKDILSATLYINTCGPWADHILKLKTPKAKKTLSLSKGVHIVVPKQTQEHALLVTTKTDNRVFFIIPWNGQTLIGTTDTFYTYNPDDVSVTNEDINYLLESANLYLKTALTQENVISSFAGLRPLIKSKKATASAATREHKIIVDNNLITLIGGKYTTFRSMAEAISKKVCNILTPEIKFHSLTKNRPLYGGKMPLSILLSEHRYQKASKKAPLTQIQYETLVKTFGSETEKVIEFIQENPNGFLSYKNTAHLQGTFEYCKAYEFVKTEEDFERRRTNIQLLSEVKTE